MHWARTERQFAGNNYRGPTLFEKTACYSVLLHSVALVCYNVSKTLQTTLDCTFFYATMSKFEPRNWFKVKVRPEINDICKTVLLNSYVCEFERTTRKQLRKIRVPFFGGQKNRDINFTSRAEELSNLATAKRETSDFSANFSAT